MSVSHCAMRPVYLAHGWLAGRLFYPKPSPLKRVVVKAALVPVRWCLDMYEMRQQRRRT